MDQLTKHERYDFKQKCSYMFQGTALFDALTVFDNIALPLKERRGTKSGMIRRLVREKLVELDIQGIEAMYPSQISEGMKKRVAMARALITKPDIVLFDEPTTGLDPIRKGAAYHMITNYQRRFGFTGIMVSHEIPDVFYISQRIAMLDAGQIIFQGSCREIRESDHPVVHNFLQGWRGDMPGLTCEDAADHERKDLALSP